MTDYLYSADDHIWEPADLWQSRLPKSLRDRALHFRFTDGIWMQIGDDGEQLSAAELFRRDDGSAIDADISRRLEDMEADGVWAQVLYPQLGMQMFFPDGELALAHARVYNDFLVEAYGPYPDRFVPIACIPVNDVPAAVTETLRVAAKGLRGIMVPLLPPRPYFLEIYDPLWSAAADCNVTVAFHIATGYPAANDGKPVEGFRPGDLLLPYVSGSSRRDIEARRTIGSIDVALAVQRDIAAVVGAGVLERHPNLHIISAENNAHWLASLAGAMDKAWTLGIGQGPAELRAGFYDESRPVDSQPGMVMPFAQNEKWPYPLMPSEYVRRQVHASFMDDPVAIANRHILGVETLLWSSDYPHPEGTWPRSREAVDNMFEGVSSEDRVAITRGTMAKLYQLSAPAT